MARFEVNRSLDQDLAARVALPAVTRTLDMLLDTARRRAPGTRTWVSMRDERVRLTHVEADGQTIPDNLRFKIRKPGQQAMELAQGPRDPDLSIANRAECRCQDMPLPHVLRESIRKTAATLSGTAVRGTVETRFPRAAESNYGTTEDPGAHFFDGALREVATRLGQGQAR